MNNRRYKWPGNIEVKCDPRRDIYRRYVLKIFPKDGNVVKKEILVIMLNPSDADNDWSDHTCKVLMKICKCNGYNSITICNLFSSRGQVEKLNEFMENDKANDEISDKKLEEQINKFDEVLCAWGGPHNKIRYKKILIDRIKKILKILKSQKLRGKKILKLKIDKKSGKLYPSHPQGKHANIEFKPYCIEDINISE